MLQGPCHETPVAGPMLINVSFVIVVVAVTGVVNGFCGGRIATHSKKRMAARPL